MLSDEQRNRLFDYLDGRLDASDRAEFERQLESDGELRAALGALRELQSAGADWRDVPVPAWSRLRGVTAGPGGRGGNWLGWLSLATSTVAMILVLFSAQVQVSEDGFSISFGAGAGAGPAGLERRMVEVQRDSTDYINQRLDLMEERSRAMNRQLLTAALEYTRLERQDDLRQLTASWARTRDSDLLRLEQLRDSQFDDHLAIRQLYTQLPTTRPGSRLPTPSDEGVMR